MSISFRVWYLNKTGVNLDSGIINYSQLVPLLVLMKSIVWLETPMCIKLFGYETLEARLEDDNHHDECTLAITRRDWTPTKG